MKKIFILFVLALMLAACKSPSEEVPKEDEVVKIEEVENVEEVEEKEDVPTIGVESDDSESEEVEERPKEESEKEESQDLEEISSQIFAAQNEKDYDFLQSILSKGSKIDKNNNMFIFENVTYPHEQEFLTDEDFDELEFRFTNENESGTTTVGFGAINYEKEFSFTIDLTFIEEDGKWKLNDMDINK